MFHYLPSATRPSIVAVEIAVDDMLRVYKQLLLARQKKVQICKLTEGEKSLKLRLSPGFLTYRPRLGCEINNDAWLHKPIWTSLTIKLPYMCCYATFELLFQTTPLQSTIEIIFS